MSSDFKASALDEPSFHDADREFFTEAQKPGNAQFVICML